MHVNHLWRDASMLVPAGRLNAVVVVRTNKGRLLTMRGGEYNQMDDVGLMMTDSAVEWAYLTDIVNELDRLAALDNKNNLDLDGV